MKFLIVSHGRSGTKFLANNLRCSHEGSINEERNVSSILRDYVLQNGPPEGRKLGMILRHPEEIYLSACWKSWDKKQFNNFIEGFYTLGEIDDKYHPEIIYFDYMTTDRVYLKSVMLHYRAKGMPNMNKVNERDTKGKYSKNSHLQFIKEELDWFINRYSL